MQLYSAVIYLTKRFIITKPGNLSIKEFYVVQRRRLAFGYVYSCYKYKGNIYGKNEE